MAFPFSLFTVFLLSILSRMPLESSPVTPVPLLLALPPPVALPSCQSLTRFAPSTHYERPKGGEGVGERNPRPRRARG